MDDQTARTLPLDSFAAWMLSEGRYDVDVDTGVVTNRRTGGTISPIVADSDYRFVNLVFSRAVVRQVKVHRLVVIKRDGVDAARGHQVAHRNHDKSDNRGANLWLAPSASEHMQHDRATRPWASTGSRAGIVMPPRKVEWAPCVRCRDPDGPAQGQRAPDRISGARFGVDGELCRRCYRTLHERERRANTKGA